MQGLRCHFISMSGKSPTKSEMTSRHYHSCLQGRKGSNPLAYLLALFVGAGEASRARINTVTIPQAHMYPWHIVQMFDGRGSSVDSVPASNASGKGFETRTRHVLPWRHFSLTRGAT